MSDARVLADRLIPGEGLLWEAARVAAGNTLMVLLAWTVLPLGWTPVPVTGQTLGVMLVAALLGSRRGALVMALYLAEGFAGLPVFQPLGLPGVARLAGPTAGFLLAFPVAAFVIGALVERVVAASAGWRRTVRLAGAMAAGEVIIFAGGCAWIAWGLGQGWPAALALGAAPFVVFEAVKIAIAVAAVRGVELARAPDSR